MTTPDPDALQEGITWLRAHYDTPDVLAVCDAAARAAEAERERDEYHALWKARSDVRAYDKVCAERDEARAHIDRLERILTNERLAFPRYFVGSVKDRDAVAADALRATLTDIERLLRAGWVPRPAKGSGILWEVLEQHGSRIRLGSLYSAHTLPAAVRAAVEELEKPK